MRHAIASIATPQTDAALQRRYSAMGRAAFKAGAARQCRMDPNSMLAAFWFQGWDEASAEIAEFVRDEIA